MTAFQAGRNRFLGGWGEWLLGIRLVLDEGLMDRDFIALLRVTSD